MMEPNALAEMKCKNCLGTGRVQPKLKLSDDPCPDCRNDQGVSTGWAFWLWRVVCLHVTHGRNVFLEEGQVFDWDKFNNRMHQMQKSDCEGRGYVLPSDAERTAWALEWLGKAIGGLIVMQYPLVSKYHVCSPHRRIDVKKDTMVEALESACFEVANGK